MRLAEIVPWGRSLAEYQTMFALTEADLMKRILGVGDGPASFNAELTARGGQVVSVDPIYTCSADEIRQRIEQTSGTIVEQLHRHTDQYIWTTFGDADELGQHRLLTMEHFLADYPAGLQEGRYVPASLPKFDEMPDRSFDIALVSHLLFLYSEQLSKAFHLESVMELLRVANEVRLFPFLTLASKESPYIDATIDYVTRAGYTVELSRVDYEFQRGGNQMMLIRRSL